MSLTELLANSVILGLCCLVGREINSQTAYTREDEKGTRLLDIPHLRLDFVPLPDVQVRHLFFSLLPQGICIKCGEQIIC